MTSWTVEAQFQATRVTLKTRGNLATRNKHQSKRGKVLSFSAKSRKRLLDMTASIDLNAAIENSPIVFLTLTYGTKFPDCELAKKHLKAFIMRIRRFAPQASGFWRVEFQKRGAPHFHFILFNLPYWDKDAIAKAWYEVIGAQFGDLSNSKHSRPRTRIEALKSARKAFYYVSKYCAKMPEKSDVGLSLSHISTPQWNGRFWGYINKQGLPFAIETVVSLVPDVIVVRAFYQFRRLMAQKWPHAQHTGRWKGATIYAWNGSNQWYEAFLYCLNEAIAKEKSNYVTEK